MDQVIEKTFSGGNENLDGKNYQRCTFTNCTLIYAGGQLPVMETCRFDGCRWQFDGAANRTLEFLGGLCRMGEPVTRQGIEAMFRNMLGG